MTSVKNISDQGQALVVFTPSGKRGHFCIGTSILQAARSLGVDLDSVCGGRGICARCQVVHITGEFSKHGIVSELFHLSPFDATEELLSNKRNKLKPGRRLGCTAKLKGDCVIDVPSDSQMHPQLVRKEAEHLDIVMNPGVKLYFVEVEIPGMEEPVSDLRRLLKALKREWGLEKIEFPHDLLPKLQPLLREDKWKLTVAVDQEQRIRGLWPGLKENLYGLAVDIGSTTIAAHLCDLQSGEVITSSGVMNPQIRFGEDLMSRVSYVMLNPGGEIELTQSVRKALNQLAEEVTKNVDLLPVDIIEMVFVGNPIMHHLLHGISPIQLGLAPFTLTTDESIETSCKDLNLNVHPYARCYTFPCIAGHVGADTAAMILAEAPHFQEDMTLLVDVGTNAEIVLGNNKRLLAASSPTGPAFEGAQISSGQRAASGAIERVRVNALTFEPRFKVIGCELWSDDPEFKEATKQMGVTGICGSGIIELIAELFLAGIIKSDGLFNETLIEDHKRFVKEGKTFTYLLHLGEPEVRLTQNDIRAIQLAKAALYAGIRILMDRLVIEQVDRIRLAGAFGSHIDVKYAMVLGMIPDCNLEQVSSAGNAAGTGARIALLNYDSRNEIEATARNIEKIETALEASFQQHFVDAMAIPHQHSKYTFLQKVVKLPHTEKSKNKSSKRFSKRHNKKRLHELGNIYE